MLRMLAQDSLGLKLARAPAAWGIGCAGATRPNFGRRVESLAVSIGTPWMSNRWVNPYQLVTLSRSITVLFYFNFLLDVRLNQFELWKRDDFLCWPCLTSTKSGAGGPAQRDAILAFCLPLILQNRP